jgi:hypothetical protein
MTFAEAEPRDAPAGQFLADAAMVSAWKRACEIM